MITYLLPQLMIVGCPLQGGPLHQLRPTYSCSKPVKQSHITMRKKKSNENGDLFLFISLVGLHAHKQTIK